MVVLVGDVNISIAVHRNPGRFVELSFAATERAPFEEKTTLGIEPLDPMVLILGHVQGAVAAHRQGARLAELAIPGAIGTPFEYKRGRLLRAGGRRAEEEGSSDQCRG